MESKKTIDLSEQNFTQEVLQSDIPVLVDFWASWCGPCRMIAPIIERLSLEYSGRAKLCKLDVDAFGSVAAKYGVMGIPTIILFKNGEESSRFVGVQPEPTLRQALDKLL